MSSIHYKFKSTLQYKTLQFEGLHIAVEELKRVICEKENIKSESFDLIFTNAHTKREYGTDDYVPRNCSVVVQRTPRENAAKLPKVQDTSTSGIVARNTASQDKSYNFMSESQFAKLSEAERLALVKEASYQKYQPSNYNRRTVAIMSGPPPPTYTCNRCYQHGHWLKNCPMTATKRTTGVPMEELMETTKDDPLAWLHPSGKFVVPIMHYQARQQRKREAPPSSTSAAGGGEDGNGVDDTLKIPPELACPLCKNLLREAVLTTCCGDSFCAECIQQRVLDDDQHQTCPNPECHQRITADSLVPNNKMRQAAQKFLSTNGASAATTSAIAATPVVGANKPDPANTSSLLHKLLPDLSSSPGDASRSPSQYLQPIASVTAPPTLGQMQANAAVVGTLSVADSTVPSLPPYAAFNIPPPNMSVPPPNFSTAPVVGHPIIAADMTAPPPLLPSAIVAKVSPPPQTMNGADIEGRRQKADCVIPGEMAPKTSRSNGPAAIMERELDDSIAVNLAWESLLKRNEKTDLSSLVNRDSYRDGDGDDSRLNDSIGNVNRRKRVITVGERSDAEKSSSSSKRFKDGEKRKRHDDETTRGHSRVTGGRDRHLSSRRDASSSHHRRHSSRDKRTTTTVVADERPSPPSVSRSFREPKPSDPADDDDEEDQIERIIRETKEMKRKAAEAESSEAVEVTTAVSIEDSVISIIVPIEASTTASVDAEMTTPTDESSAIPIDEKVKSRIDVAEKSPAVNAFVLADTTTTELLSADADTTSPSDTASPPNMTEQKNEDENDEADRLHHLSSTDVEKFAVDKEKKPSLKKDKKSSKKEKKTKKDKSSKKAGDKEKKKKKKESKEKESHYHRHHHRDDDDHNDHHDDEKRSARKHKKHHKHREERNGHDRLTSSRRSK